MWPPLWACTTQYSVHAGNIWKEGTQVRRYHSSPMTLKTTLSFSTTALFSQSEPHTCSLLSAAKYQRQSESQVLQRSPRHKVLVHPLMQEAYFVSICGSNTWDALIINRQVQSMVRFSQRRYHSVDGLHHWAWITAQLLNTFYAGVNQMLKLGKN